jgi:hypothetical protein
MRQMLARTVLRPAKPNAPAFAEALVVDAFAIRDARFPTSAAP